MQDKIHLAWRTAQLNCLYLFGEDFNEMYALAEQCETDYREASNG